ncbi:MAG: hypothetical protein ABI597_11775 [Gammaproteobacteria bacterium]
MQNRISTCTILNQLQQSRTCSFEDFSLQTTSMQLSDNAQDELNRIANQASNFGHGAGVALQKAFVSIKNQLPNLQELKNHCSNLKLQLASTRLKNSLGTLFSSQPLTNMFLTSSISSNAQDRVVECEQTYNRTASINECLDASLHVIDQEIERNLNPTESTNRQLEEAINAQGRRCRFG